MVNLFVYGSLQPGGPNEHVLGSIDGEWTRAVVKGHLKDVGWGAELGYAGLVLDQDGREVDGYVLSSTELSNHWGMLDEFEGEEYERVTTAVTLASGMKVEAHTYVLRDP